MGWTLSGTLAKATAPLRMRSRWASPSTLAHATDRANDASRTDTVYARRCAAIVAECSTADRKALEAARSQMGDDAGVAERAVASGAPVQAVAALAAAWEGLSPEVKDVIRDPVGGSSPGQVRWGKVRAKQMDQRTCGAAVLAMVLLIADPYVSLWLMTGRTLSGHVPTDLRHLKTSEQHSRTVQERWHALQRVLFHEVTRLGFVVAPWPRYLGTPPWRIRAVARCAGVRWRIAVVDDTKRGEMTAMATHASAALKDGIPVMVYSGGDTTKGVSKAAPRHVVLMTSRTKDGFMVYEPGSGMRRLLRDADLVRDSVPHPALGNWARINWLVLPSPRRRQ